LRVKVLGMTPQGPQPVSNAVLRVVGAVEGAFSDPASAVPPESEHELINMRTQMSRQHLQALEAANATFSFSYGCPISFTTVTTDADGMAEFLFDASALKGLQVLQATKALG